MDTNLKRSKKIRAFFYRMIALGSLLCAIATGIMGKEVVAESSKNGGNFSRDIYYLAEFREYISILCNNAMIGYAGIGDDNGYPLTDNNKKHSNRALSEFYTMIEDTKGDIVYYMLKAEGGMDEDGNRTGGVEMSNLDYPVFSEYDGHLLLPDDVRLCCYWDGENGTLHYFDNGMYQGEGYTPMDRYYKAQYKPNKEAAADMQLIIALKDDFTSYPLRMMAWKARCYQALMVLFVVSLTMWIVFGICSLFSGKAAKQAIEDYAKISAKIWLEVKIIIVFGALVLLYYSNLLRFGADLTLRMPLFGSLWVYFPIGCLMYLYYVDLKQNKEKVFYNCIPVKIFSYVKEFFRGMPWYRRALIWNLCTLLGAILLLVVGLYLLTVGTSVYLRIRHQLSVFTKLMLIMSVLLFYGFLRQKRMLKDTAAVVHKLSEMKNGRGNVPLILPQSSLLNTAARDLNELENGIKNAVEQQNRSNRMKVELITNVSHDLKTPLTSIINYADLLCEEELPDTAAEYAEALQKKAYRLKKMVQDVFDLSKATSGNLVVEKAEIDLVKLIKQTLADMDERIQESKLTFKLNISNEPLMIEADGEKLYRVFQNLFVNALQYSLDHSRVFVQLAEEEGFAVARVKNVSRMELDFDTTEIVERFVRADSSRTTEGSGLGLSIVQSFTEACGGQFMIETDADMFTACVRFPLSERGENETQEN